MDGHPRCVFSQTEILGESYIEPPQIARFSKTMFNKTFLSVDELVSHMEV